jgi:hypothetical protein
MMKKIQLVLACAVASISQITAAADRLVPAQYPTIQAAIDASANGDVVQISPGNYAGPIDLRGKAITVRGASSTSASIISGGASVVRCMTAESANTIIENLTITGGTGAVGAGFRIEGASPTVRNCKVIGNVVELISPTNEFGCCGSGGNGYGTGIYILGGAPTVSNCLIGGNRLTVHGAAGYGVGIYVENSSASISDCTITGNVLKANLACCGAAGLGAGACVVGDGSMTPTFLRCTLATNQMEVAQAPGNNGGSCGAAGVAIYASCPMSLTDCRIKGNINSGCGGVIGAARFASNLVSVSGCTFCENPCGNTNGAYLDLGGNRFPATCASCSGDLNGDGFIDGTDLGTLLSRWGPCTN